MTWNSLIARLIGATITFAAPNRSKPRGASIAAPQSVILNKRPLCRE
jgi:hypothetical protein